MGYGEHHAGERPRLDWTNLPMFPRSYKMSWEVFRRGRLSGTVTARSLRAGKFLCAAYFHAYCTLNTQRVVVGGYS